nr:uncharacterized protein LOC129269480 [Lytechinus pictus]
MDGSKLQGLLCPMCFDILTTAKTLKCGHSFCNNCLEGDNEAICPLCSEENLAVGAGQGDVTYEEKSNDKGSAVGVGDDLPAVSSLTLGGESTSADKQNSKSSADDGTKKAGEQLKPTSSESANCGTSGNITAKVVSVVQIPRRACNVNGMAATSKDSVVVGFGWDGKGSDCFSMSGDKTQHLKPAVGNVCDIAFLSNGNSVVSLGNNTGRVYDPEGTKTDTKYSFIQGLGHPCLCTDQQDNVYVVNGNPSIYIFKGNTKDPHTVVPTGNILPLQVCVTKGGVMITSTGNFTRGRITVYDKTGNAGSSIAAAGSDNDEDNEDGECIYATVDDQDRVLIARVVRWSSVISLTRYTLEGTELLEDVAFGEIPIPHQIDMACWCYVVTLTPKMLVFANDCFLYFIELLE